MRLYVFTLLFALVAVFQTATTAQAANQLFEGSWSVKAQGNECLVGDPSPGPFCAVWGPGDRVDSYSAIGIPLGVQCDPFQPRCPFRVERCARERPHRPAGDGLRLARQQ